MSYKLNNSKILPFLNEFGKQLESVDQINDLGMTICRNLRRSLSIPYVAFFANQELNFKFINHNVDDLFLNNLNLFANRSFIKKSLCPTKATWLTEKETREMLSTQIKDYYVRFIPLSNHLELLGSLILIYKNQEKINLAFELAWKKIIITSLKNSEQNRELQKAQKVAIKNQKTLEDFKAQLEKKNKSLSICNELINSLQEMTEILQIAKTSIKILSSHTWADYSIFLSVNHDSQKLKVVAKNHLDSFFHKENPDIPIEKTLTYRAIKENRIMYSLDIKEDERIHPTYREMYLKQKLLSFVIIPIATHNVVFSVIILGFKKVINPNRFDWLTLSSIGKTIGFAMAHAQAISRLKDQACSHIKTVQKLRQSESIFQAFIKQTKDAIVRCDFIPPINARMDREEMFNILPQRCIITEYNKKFLLINGRFPNENLIGASIKDFVHPRNYATFFSRFVQDKFCVNKFLLKVSRTKNRTQWLEINLTTIVTNKKLKTIFMTLSDITDSTESFKKLEYQAYHDLLTGLWNREYIVKRLEVACNDHSRSFSFLLLDLNHFKEINDTLGHQAGDQILKEIGSRLKPILQSNNGELARLGGDEFAVYLPLWNYQTVLKVAEELLLEIKKPFILSNVKLEISTSIGIANFPEDGLKANALIRCADVAMYVAKNQGIGISQYAKKLDQHTPLRLTLVMELGQAIQKNHLLLYFQPIISANDGKISCMEALVRWNHPIHGIILPDQFIPIAEISDLITPLSKWVFKETARILLKWQNQGIDIRMAINLSPRILLDQNLLEMVQKLPIDASKIELEITESSILANWDSAKTILNRYLELGISISIDDFGTGFSTFQNLKYLPIQKVKIDRLFIKEITDNKQDLLIVTNIISLANSLGIETVAEGLEDEKSIKLLKKLKCNYLQGYEISRPLPENLAFVFAKKHFN